MILPRPRAYIDWTVPLDDQGREMGTASGKEQYRCYLGWLADHLYNTDIPVPENQRVLLEEYQKRGADYAVIDLSDMLGYSIWDTDLIEYKVEEDQPFDDLHQLELDYWNDLSDDEKKEWEGEEFFTLEDEFLRIREEYMESKQVPSHIRHADIPYRPILASLFKSIRDFEERCRLLDLFYRNYHDCASK